MSKNTRIKLVKKVVLTGKSAKIHADLCKICRERDELLHKQLSVMIADKKLTQRDQKLQDKFNKILDSAPEDVRRHWFDN